MDLHAGHTVKRRAVGPAVCMIFVAAEHMFRPMFHFAAVPPMSARLLGEMRPHRHSRCYAVLDEVLGHF